MLLFGVGVTSLPFLLTANYGVTPVFVGSVLAATEAAAAVVAAENGRLARRLPDDRIIALGLGCYGVGLVGAWAAPSLAFLVAGVVVFGAGVGLTMPSVDALLSGLVGREFRAGALSIRNSVTFLGRAVGPVLFAGAAAETGYRPLLLASGAVGTAAAAAALALGRGDVD